MQISNFFFQLKIRLLSLHITFVHEIFEMISKQKNLLFHSAPLHPTHYVKEQSVITIKTKDYVVLSKHFHALLNIILFLFIMSKKL